MSLFCPVAVSNSDVATIYINKLLAAAAAGAYQNVPGALQQTITYVTTNQGELTTSVQTCQQFFLGLQTSLLTDLGGYGFSLTAANSQLINYIDNIIAPLLVLAQQDQTQFNA
jgi:hypothetical protein